MIQMRGYVNDATETPQTVYVGLYNTGGGIYLQLGRT